MPEGIDNLPFTIRGVPSTVTSPRSLFRLIAPDYDLEFPFVLCFSNLGPPKRTWHSHYNVKYRPVSQSIVTAHLHMEKLEKTDCVRTVVRRNETSSLLLSSLPSSLPTLPSSASLQLPAALVRISVSSLLVSPALVL